MERKLTKNASIQIWKCVFDYVHWLSFVLRIFVFFIHAQNDLNTLIRVHFPAPTLLEVCVFVSTLCTCSIFMTLLLCDTAQFCCYFYYESRIQLLLFFNSSFPSSSARHSHSSFYASLHRHHLYSFSMFFFALAPASLPYFFHIHLSLFDDETAHYQQKQRMEAAASGGWWRRIRVKVNATMLFKKL